MNISAVIFDLDFTLYDHHDYISGALEHISEITPGKLGINKEEFKEKLFSLADRHGYLHEKLFNLVLESFYLYSDENLALMINDYHSYNPVELTCYPGVEDIIKFLKSKDLKVGIITDGNIRTQKLKCELLKVSEWTDFVVFSSEMNTSKPDKMLFEFAAEKAGLEPQRILFVGDHPEKDIYGAANAGMKTARIMKGEFKDLPDIENFKPDHKLGSVSELKKIII